MKNTKAYFETNCKVIETEDGFYRWSNRFKDYIPLKLTLHTQPHPYGGPQQYYFCSFYDLETKKGFSIPYHRFLWIWRNGNINPKLDVDHIDGNSLNNEYTNLRLCTRSENLKNRKGKSNQYGKDFDPDYQKTKALISYLKEEYKKQGDKFRWHMFCNLERNWHNYDKSIRDAIIDSIMKNL